MSKQPEIVIIDDDDDDNDDIISAEITAANQDYNGINNKIIQHDILSAAVVVAKNGDQHKKNECEPERPSISVPNNERSPFRINKHNNPNSNNGRNKCIHDVPLNDKGGFVKAKDCMDTGSQKTIKNDVENNDDADDDDTDQEQLPITQLPQPNYETQFKSTILKPLHNILDSLKQDEILSVVRMHLFVIMQGIYLEARRIYVDQNELLKNKTESNSHGSDNMNGEEISCSTSLIGRSNQDFDKDFFLNAPGLYIHNEENVFEHNMSECTFVDPDAEEITKKKLLPQTLKMLLKLGEGGGDRKSTFGIDAYCLSVTAEDLIACILLDFVGMVTKILSLVETMEEQMNGQRHHNGCNGNGGSNINLDVDKEMNPSKKRRRIEHTNESSSNNTLDGKKQNTQSQSPSNKKTKPLPNILHYIGDEMLSVFIKVLGSESCCAGYNQSLLHMRREEANSETSVEDAVYLYLPPFYKSHLFDTSQTPVDNDVKMLDVNDCNDNQDDCVIQGNQLKDDFLSALRTGEWRKYYLLYRPSDASRDLHQPSHHPSANDEGRDAPFESNNLFTSRHVVAMTRYFVQGGGLANINKVLLDSSDSGRNLIFDKVDVDILASVIAIFQTISFIFSYCIDRQAENVGYLKASSVDSALEDFKGILRQFLRESTFRIHDFTQQNQRKILEIIGTLEDRSLTSFEFTRLSESPITHLPFTFSPCLNFDRKESHEMKLTALWKLLTGRNPGEDIGASSTSKPPSLQCQISALNEINGWLKNLENEVQSYRDQYIKMCNETNDANHPVMNSDNINATSPKSQQYTSISAVAATKHSDPVIVSDEMPRLIHSDNLNNDFLNEAKKDNESTEVCCYSNDSISSTNSEHDDVKMTQVDQINGGVMYVDDANTSKQQGDLAHNLLQENETEFYGILELLTSKYNVFSHLFSPLGVHTELLKRSLPLLDVLSRNGILKEEHLKLLWDVTGFSARAKDTGIHVHSSVTSTVFDLLLGLVNNNNGWMALNGDMISYYENFFSEVIDIGRWTHQSLHLVEIVAHRSIDLTIYKVLAGKDQNVESICLPAGLDLLWQLSQDNCDVTNISKKTANADIALNALTRVIDILVTKCQQSKMNSETSCRETNEQFSQREKTVLQMMQWIQTKIITRVIDSMKHFDHSTTNTTNIRILYHLLSRLPTSLSRESNSNHVKRNGGSAIFILTIDDVVNYDDLLSVLVDEMVSYCTRAKGHLMRQKEQNDDGSAIHLSNVYTHKDCVFYRQQLFQLYVSRCFNLSSTYTNQPKQEPVKVPSVVARPVESIDLVEDESLNEREVKIIDDFEETTCEGPNSNQTEKDCLFPTQVQVSTLWKCFVVDESLNVVDYVVEMLYNLLTSTVLESSPQILQWRKQLVSTLHPLCLDLDTSSMSVTMYKLLIYCIGHQNAFCGNFHTVSYIAGNQKARRFGDKIRMMSNSLLGLPYNSEATTCSNSLYLSGQAIIEEVSNYSIIGLDKLWTIMLETYDDNVANMAMTYMSVLYNFPPLRMKLKSSSETFAEQVSFAKHCVAELNAEHQSRKRQTRLLHLMKLFVQHSTNVQDNGMNCSHGTFTERINTLEVESVITMTSPFSLNVQVLKGPKLTIYCPLGEKTKISFLRDSISRHVNQAFRLVFSGSELKQSSDTLAKHQIKADANIYCCPHLSTKHVQNVDTIHIVEPLNEDHDKDERSMQPMDNDLLGESTFSIQHSSEPKPLIAPGIAELLGDDCLKKLFDLLSSLECDEQEQNVCHLKALVWDLLQSLPTKPSVWDAISNIFYTHQLQETPIEQFLPFPDMQATKISSLFSMLYSLQVVERIFLHVKEGYSMRKNSKKPRKESHRKRKANEKEEMDIVVVDDLTKNNQQTSNGQKLKTVVVIDDDYDDNGSVQQVNGDGNFEDDGVHIADKVIEPREIVENFVQNGGLKQVLKLFLSFDGRPFMANASENSENQYNHELCSLIVTCANKLTYLLINITSLDERYSQSTLESTDSCALILNQLMKMIHWAVVFQLRSTAPHSHSSKYVTGGWSSAEIGSALGLHCLKFMNLIATKISSTNMKLKMTIKTQGIIDAMKSSLIYSPSNIVRSSALPVFKQLIYLIDEGENNAKRQRIDKSIDDENMNNFHLPSLSLLVSLLPVGREMPPSTSLDQSSNAILTRCSVLFDFVTGYISNAFSKLSTAIRAKASNIIVRSLQRMKALSFSDEILHEPPEINAIDDMGNLVFWIILEIKILTSNEFHAFETYIEGLVSILQSVILVLQTEELKTVIASLFVSEDETLLQLLFKSATFAEQKHNHRTKLFCTVSSLRGRLLAFLSMLCKGVQENEISLLNLLSSHLYSSVPRKDLVRDWSLDPVLKQKGFNGHVGMKNQGATCYLNSLLQQFFHTSAFRSGLMSCEVGHQDSSDETSEEGRLLFELQRLFGNLLMSEKRDFDTMDLVKTIKGYDGKTIRPGEQQDVDEFFNLFCTRLETALKESPQSRLLHDVFGGQISHLITCKTCHKSSERVEDFLSISLDVKGKHNIYESLYSYIRGEVLDGSNKYFCSHCDSKRDSIKRCCFKTLPNVLIFHLKRFDFDLEQLRKIKVNDRFEYPLELNMKQFTKEGLKDVCESELDWRKNSYYHYTLRGVVVHTGTADSGHYYSLSHVRDRDSTQSNEHGTDGSWFCFNDSVVSPFDLATLESTTFGGLNDTTYRHKKRNDASKSYSAYLLIYDRVDQYKFDEQLVENPQKSRLSSSASTSNQWEGEIIEQNLRHAKDQVIFSADYGRFVTDVCSVAVKGTGTELAMKAIETMTCHLLDNVIHVRDRANEIENQFSLLTSWYEQNDFSCRRFLKILSTSHRLWLEQLFFHCYKSEIRISFVKLLGTIFQKLAPIERKTYYDGTDTEVIGNDAFDADGDISVFAMNGNKTYKDTMKRIEYWKSKSVLARFIGTLINMLDECKEYWRRFDQLFDCLTKFANCGHEEAIFLIRSGVVLRLIHIYQGEKINVSASLIIRPPQCDTDTNKVQIQPKFKLGDKDKRPNFLPLLQLFSVLIRSGNLRDEADDEISDSDSSLEEDKSQDNDKCDERKRDAVLTKNYVQTLHATNLTYDLPKRDCYLATNREMIESMLSEHSMCYVHKDLEANQKKLTTTISQILCQICFNNLEKTLLVCALAQRIIKERKASETYVAVKVLSSLVYINDNHSQQRIKSVSAALFEGISSNATYEHELLLILESLHEQLVKRSPGFQGSRNEVYFHSILLDNVEKFTSLFGKNVANTAKHKLLCVIKSLLPIKKRDDVMSNKECQSVKTIRLAYSGHELKEYDSIFASTLTAGGPENEQVSYVEEEIIKNKIFAVLKNLHMNITDAISELNSPSRNSFITNGMLNTSHIIESSMFFEYYATLRECLTGSKWQGRFDGDDDSWIYTLTDHILPTFWDLDNGGRNQQRCPADLLKGEIIRLFERFAQIDPKQFINAILDKHQTSPMDATDSETSTNCNNDTVTKMLEVFITTSNNFDYNNTYMVHFYALLALLADNDKHFHTGVLTHENWKWALRSFALNKKIAKRGPLYDVILQNSLKYINENGRFRKSIYKLLSESFLQHDHINTAVLQLLCSIFDSERVQSSKDSNFSLECIAAFVSGNCGGMSKMSSLTKKLFLQTSKDFSEYLQEIESLFEDLYYCINCMFIIIETLDHEDVVKVMKECWPEVDEMNTIFMQIVTRADDEWKDCYKDSVQAETHLEKAVSKCRELQHLLIKASN